MSVFDYSNFQPTSCSTRQELLANGWTESAINEVRVWWPRPQSPSQQVAQPEPQRPMNRVPPGGYVSRASSEAQSISSSNFRCADPVNPAEVQALYERYNDDPRYGYSSRSSTNHPGSSTVGVSIEELQEALPGIGNLPLRELRRGEREPAYGVWEPYTAPWDSRYFPGKELVKELWQDVWRNRSEERICNMFDHVDLYRLAFITVTHKKTVEEPSCEIVTLSKIVEIFNRAGRPPGFGRTLRARPQTFEVEHVSRLFKILASKDNPKRDKAFSYVKGAWVWTLDWSPRRLIRGVPETVKEVWDDEYKFLVEYGYIRDQFLMEAFMYRDGNDYFANPGGPPDWRLETMETTTGAAPESQGASGSKRHAASSSATSPHHSRSSSGHRSRHQDKKHRGGSSHDEGR
ncbi:hypothetical protein DSL72_008818 [Monilinia vaccinii-corymbosi]|uniref:Uncharacterized protein n=1 Tax=Monilinia vaccinii-corymbosi TaxID=61207 RepID=A0A8A3PS72_9HELO|nr:hypothetical protein DSL72_008818 [Monilinia vaccinii-corymbosi]